MTIDFSVLGHEKTLEGNAPMDGQNHAQLPPYGMDLLTPFLTLGMTRLASTKKWKWTKSCNQHGGSVQYLSTAGFHPQLQR